MEIAMAAIVTG